jgi:hypothetical protein
MHNPLLYRELHSQLSQWIHPKDKRHLQGFAENVAAILQSQSGCLSHWIPFLSHRDCQARSHLERLSYFLKNGKMNLEEFYQALLRHCLQALAGSDLKLTLDTSMLWDEYCLISVCLIWGGRSLTLAQTVIEHKSATVAFEQYRPVLESVIAVLPPSVSVTLLADRGFEHSELCRWLNQKDWNWAIRAKCNLKVTFANGLTQSVKELFPPDRKSVV